MACSLNGDQIADVFGLIYHKVLNSQGPTNVKDLVKFFYDLGMKGTNDPEKAVLYAQAVPEIFLLVSTQSNIRKKLRESKFDYNALDELIDSYENLDNVISDTSPATTTFEEVEEDLKNIEKNKHNSQLSDDTELTQSDLEKRDAAKIEFPNRTTFQSKKSVNPTKVSKASRNLEDTQKDIFIIVQKNIVAAVRNKSISTNDVMYGDTPIVLSLVKSSLFPKEHKLREHLTAEDIHSTGIYAVVTDKDGNYLYFDKEGNITDKDAGTVVYTFLRKVEKENGKLTLLYHTKLGDNVERKFANTLVEASKIAEREYNVLSDQGYDLAEDFVETRTQEIFDEQNEMMNGLYKLREAVLASDDIIKLNITDGSLGIINTEAYYQTALKLGITDEELSTYKTYTDKNNPKSGYSYITINVPTPVGTLPFKILLQKGDFNEVLATQLANVLTTKAKLASKGNKQLDAKERLAFFEVLIDNSINAETGMNREKITAKVVNKELVVTILNNKGEKVVLKESTNLFTKEAFDVIHDHLKHKEDNYKGFPIPVSINIKKNIVNDVNSTFTDYEIDGDTIKEKEQAYLPFLKSFVKAKMDDDFRAYLNGTNPYLVFEIPAEFTKNPEFSMLESSKNVKSAPKKTEEKKYKEAREVEPAEETPIDYADQIDTVTNDNNLPTDIDSSDIDSSDIDLDDIEDLLDQMERNKAVGNFLDRLFTTEADKQRAEEMWKKSPLSKFISLERISKVVNSDAFATFNRTAITLYEGDGGTAVDLYHEAWHGFTQLFLTKEEKIELYSKVKAEAKWADKDYFDIEEDLAEDYRSYAKDRARRENPKTFIDKLFNRIYNFLEKYFSGVDRTQAILRPRDIPAVNEYFNMLYEASNKPKLLQHMQPSTENIMFTKLNRTKLIRPVKEFEKNYVEFTESESLKAGSLIDSMLPELFAQYNKVKSDSSGAIKMLYNPNNRAGMYKIIEKKLQKKYETYRKSFAERAANGEDVEEHELEKFLFIGKMIDNFGDIEKSIEGTQKRGVVAYHLDNSRFKILNNKFVEIDNDPTDMNQSQLFKLDGGNTLSSKDLASETTKTILSAIYKVDRSKFSTEVVDGRKKFNISYELDEFGEPILLDFNIMWNKLAKLLAGSFDKVEMYSRMTKAIESEPEIKQLLTLLPNPANNEYKDTIERNIDVNFWQDLKKPRIPYLQLNINASKEKTGDTVYDARIANTDFDIQNVIRDWNFGFVMDNPDSNQFLMFDEAMGVYRLDVNKVVRTFTNKDGSFKEQLAKDFLNAIGIKLDYTNAAILNIASDPDFAINYGINHIFNTIRSAAMQPDATESLFISRNPIKYIMEGVTKDYETNEKINISNSRVKELAKLQAKNSDKYSNFSALSPEGNRVWEHFLDNSITRIVTSLNHGTSWQELTRAEADPLNKFQHMRWLSEDINTFSVHSILLNSLYDLRNRKRPDGRRIKNNLLLNNVAGTQLLESKKGSYDKKEGVSTASMDATAKFLQEVHTMLMNGVEEFMRHASKQMAQGLTVSNGILTKDAKKDKKLYVDIENFIPGGVGESRAFNIIAGYLTGEANRIVKYGINKNKLKNYTGYSQDVERKDENNTKVKAGQAFAAFDDVLSTKLQTELYKILDKAVEDKDTDFDFMDLLESNPDLRNRIEKDVREYFRLLTEENVDKLNQAKFLDSGLKQRIPSSENLSNAEVENSLMKAYSYNSWMHKFETSILIYGDLAQYNHAKEEFHKRNAGFGGGGRGFSNDPKILADINNLKNYYADRFKGVTTRPLDGTLRTAILKERKVDSIYYKEYYNELVKEYTERLKDKAKAEELAKTALKEYNEMKIGDGQGHITFEMYRKLKNQEGSWLPEQEELYQKVAKGEDVSVSDVVSFFPPYKLQYIGNIKTDILPVTSFHKYSLAPIIPGVAKEGTPLYDLHMKMMLDQVDYVVYESGSKIGHLGTGDVIFNEDGSLIEDSKFTVNTIFTEYLKNQTEVNSEFKGKSIFSTQMRKLILDNLYKNGKITSKSAQPFVEKYLKDVSDYTELVKLELLEEIGYDEVSPDNYQPRDKDSVSKLLELIRSNLEREDAYSNDMIDFIDALDSGQIKFDLSYHPEVLKVEKVLLSLINKRIIKQKIKGEPLVQVSSSMYENNITKTGEFRSATDEEKKKWTGSTVLPTYHKRKDGKTAAMKIMIALQGDYANLLNLEYNGETIGDIDTLNKAIKDDAWLDANNGANRKAITLVGVRIPVQGLNSMEFMEVYEFLPAQASNIIIPPAEIVAKSGGDFDIDKLTIFMSNISLDGTLSETKHKDFDSLKAEIKEKNAAGESLSQLFKEQKAGLENELIEDIKNILELPENYTSLITPNGTFLLKDIADRLASDVMKYNPKHAKMTTERKSISPTRVLESMYNLYKHESNIVGKQTLGLGAIENTFNILFNSIGAYLPKEYKNARGIVRKTNLALRHRTMNVNGEERISLSDIYDVDNINKIADVFSQAINGWVDVEKDAWIFFIQGNYEVAPILMFLVKAGVPVEEAIYFVSQPLVREYVNEQRLIKSAFAPMLGKSVESANFVKAKAVRNVINKYFPKSVLSAQAKTEIILNTADSIIDKVFEGREDKHFTLKGMKGLVERSSKDPKELKSNLSMAMFLHYIKIEDQIKGLSQIKMNSNPDTNTRSSLTDIETSDNTLDELMEDEYLSEIMSGLMNDSVISSFFNGKLSLALSKPLFKLRYNNAVSDFLLSLNKGGSLSEYVARTFGENNKKEFINTFRNDLVSYILQNTLLQTNIGNKYMSLDVKPMTETKSFESKYFGVYVKTNANQTKTILINEANLKNEFENNDWSSENDDEESVYNILGLHKLDPMTFTALERGLNYDQYKRFVIEREFLRSQNPIAEGQSKQEYEKYLAEKALDNSYNFYHLFNNADTAYANRMANLISNYPLLFRKFEVLSVLKPETNINQDIFNLGLVDRDINSTKANLYTKNLKDLANPVVLKSFAKELKLNDADIKKISELFAMLPLFAYLQSGINKSSYNLVPFVDSSNIIQILETAGNNFIKNINSSEEFKIKLLHDYLDKFMYANSKKSNPLKRQFKNYLSNFNIKSSQPAVQSGQINFKEDQNTGYTARTKINASADATLALAYDFNSRGEKATKNFVENQNKQYIGMPVPKKEKASKDLKPHPKAVEFVVNKLNEVNAKTLNIAGNGIYTMKDADYSQNDVDEMTYQLLKAVLESPDLKTKIESIRTGGQTGFDEAGAKAGMKLGIPTTILAPKGWKFRDLSGKDISDEQAFKARFGVMEFVESGTTDLIETENPNIFLYDSENKDPKDYKQVLEKNSKVIFLHSFSIDEFNSKMNKNFTDQSVVQLYSPEMSLPIITSQGKNDNLSKLDSADYTTIKNAWDTIISSAVNTIEKGYTIALPTTGFGDSSIMPQELFVYLSRELYEKLRYLNPGSLLHKEINDIIVSKQGISDEEILQSYGFESDPFNCA